MWIYTRKINWKMLPIWLIISLAVNLHFNDVNGLFIFPERAHSSQVAPTDSVNRESIRPETLINENIYNSDRINFEQPRHAVSSIIDRQINYDQNSNYNVGRYGVVQSTNFRQQDITEQNQAIANYLANPSHTEESEGRLFFDDDDDKKKKRRKKKKKKKKKKKRPCIPQKYGDRSYLPYVNLVYVEVNDNNNHYNPTGGYYCRPTFGHGQGTHGIHGAHGGGLLDALFGLDDDDEDVEYDETEDEVEDYDENVVSDNSHGPLFVSGGFLNRPNGGLGGGGGGGGGGGFGGGIPGVSGSGSGVVGGVSTGSASNGGPLGFFGQGGLFDFTGGNGAGVNPARPQVDDPYASDGVRPVIEINVPDTLQDAVTWRPGNIVGGIQNTVNGFVQQVAARPQRALRQINQELYTSLIQPFASLFY